MMLLRIAILGLLISAGAGEAFASSCDEPGSRHGFRSSGTTFVVQYGTGGHRSHWRGSHWHGNGWRDHDGWYSLHRPVVRRYVKVAAPVCEPQVHTLPAYEQTLVVNIRNANGSYTPVTLRREGNVYVGPRGERYLSVPTEDQLKDVYGLE